MLQAVAYRDQIFYAGDGIPLCGNLFERLLNGKLGQHVVVLVEIYAALGSLFVDVHCLLGNHLSFWNGQVRIVATILGSFIYFQFFGSVLFKSELFDSAFLPERRTRMVLHRAQSMDKSRQHRFTFWLLVFFWLVG